MARTVISGQVRCRSGSLAFGSAFRSFFSLWCQEFFFSFPSFSTFHIALTLFLLSVTSMQVTIILTNTQLRKYNKSESDPQS